MSAKVVGSDGVERIGRMLYVGPGQVNFLVPSDVPDGPAQLFIDILPSTRKITDVIVRRVSPGIFSATGDGRGAPAGFMLRVTSASDQSTQYLFQRSPSDGAIIPNPIVIGNSSATQQDKIYLLLFGTGIRRATRVSATLGAVSVPVEFAPQSETDGLDQVNVGPLPLNTLGRFTDLPLIITADGVESNSTTIRLQ